MKHLISLKGRLTILSLLAMALIFLGCHAGQKSTTGTVPQALKGDSLFAELERTPCFGKCPTYKISVYQSGYVVYNAVRWVKDTGLFYTFITPQQMEGISEMAKKTGFAAMKDDYHDPNITDVPTTFTSFRVNGKIKRIDNTFGDPPQELIDFEKYIDSVFAETRWIRINNRD